MPHSVNGIGTTYYGKSNIERRYTTCGSCGKEGQALSYDTGLYFCIVFIPIIPLGKKRIFDQCPSCNVHRVMKLSEWEKARSAALAEAHTLVGAVPLVAADAANGLGQMIGLGARDEFFAAAESVRLRSGGDRDILLTCATGYTRFNADELAIDCYQAALALNDDLDVRRALAIALMRAGRPVDARPQLDRLLEAGEASGEHVGVFYLQVEALQAKGMHEDALQLIAKLVEKNPTLDTDKELKKLRALSLKHKQSNKAIVSKTIKSLATPAVREGGGFNLARLIWPLAVASVPVGYLGTALWQGRHQTVHLVNGLDRPYTLSLGGADHPIGPGVHLEVEIAQGTHSISHGPITAEFTIATPFWTRLFDDSTWVVNPDRTAILTLESTTYSQVQDPAENGTGEIRTGQLLHEFHAIDYPFAEFPESISVNDTDRKFVRWRIDQIQAVTSHQGYAVVASALGPDQANDWAMLRVVETPDDTSLPLLLASTLKAEEFLSLAASYLERTPLLIEWHRAFQHVRERRGETDALAVEYEQRLATRPDDPDLLYLRGRLFGDPKQAADLYLRAVAQSPPSAYAYHALAYQQLSSAEFEQGVAFVDRAIELQPENPTFADTFRQLHQAAGHFDLLLAAARGRKPTTGVFFVGAEEIELLYQKGDRTGAETALSDYLKRLEKQASVEFREQSERVLKTRGHYLLGERAAFIEAVRSDPETGFGFEAMVTADDVAGAAAFLAEHPSQDPESHLTLYLLASRGGQREPADEALATAIQLLREAGTDERRVAEALAGSSRPPASALCELAIPPQLKKVLLASLGTRFANDRDTYFGLARRLNFDRWFPHLLVADVIGPGD